MVYGIAINNKPTGAVEVKLVEGIPGYTIHEDVAWDFIELNDTAKNVLSKADAVCFGSVAQRSFAKRNT